MPAYFRKILLSILINTPLLVIGQPRNLDYYISKGLANSPVLNDIRNQGNSGTLDSLLLAASRKPQVEGRSQLLYSPYGNNIGYDEVITDGGNYQAVAYVSQEIFNSRKATNKYQALQNERKSLNISEKVTIAELKKAIVDSYLEAYAVNSELQFNQSFLGLLKAEAGIVRNLAESGSASQSDYMSLMVETGGQEVIISQLRNSCRQSIRSLNILCGIADTAAVTLEKPDLPELGMAGNHDYIFTAQYSIDSLRIINEKEALALHYKPTVNWFADAGILTSDPLTFYRHLGASAGVSLTVPIYDGRQRKLEEQKLLLRENTRRNYLEVTKHQYDQTLASLYDRIDGLNKTKNTLLHQLKLAEELVDFLKTQMENGTVKMQDYIPAIKNLRTIRHNAILTDIEILRAKNEIDYILSK